jgi:hypothetical protein
VIGSQRSRLREFEGFRGAFRESGHDRTRLQPELQNY